MKRTLILLLVAVMVFSAFAGCGKTETPDVTTQATTEATTEATTAPTTAPTEPTMSDEAYAQMMQEAMNGGMTQNGQYDASFDDQSQNTYADPSSSKFLVGYAKADITPATSLKLPLIGNNDEKTRVATGVLTRLYATCTAMTDEKGNTVILFGMDAHGIPQDFLEAVRSAITKATGVKGKYIQMSGSHTHQAPPITKNGYGYSAATTHMNDVVKKCAEAAQKAMADRKPALMYTAFTQVEGINFCRYTYLEDGTFMGTGKASSDADYYSTAERPDDLLQIVKFDRAGGKDVLIANWQAHYRGNPSGQYTLYSADYMGVMRSQLEDSGYETVFLLGASGNLACRTDAIKAVYTNSNKNESYVSVGQTLASSAISALSYASPAKLSTIHLVEKTFNISTNSNDYKLAAFGIGDVGFVMMPYEPFQSLGMKVRSESPYKMTLIGTCANGNGGNFYLPDAKAYDAKNPYGVSKKYVKGDEQKFHKQYISMLKTCFTKNGNAAVSKPSGYIINTSTFQDSNTYTSPKNLKAVKNGLYRIDVKRNGKSAVLLVKSKSLGEQLLKKSSFKVITDTRSVVTALQ